MLLWKIVRLDIMGNELVSEGILWVEYAKQMTSLFEV